MVKYPFTEIEKKWQAYWEKEETFKTIEDPLIPPEKRAYVLDMFPYPSGTGLHVGHPEGYTATDIYCRFLRMNGYSVLHPMGFDSFGLPAENYAIKTGTHPAITTKANIDRIRKQIKSLGFSYDWSREISTSDPEYYKWTQWIFLQLFKKGLAYESEAPINWCPSCKTGLANEEVKDGLCDRCHTKVVRKNIRQWILKITDYAERLLTDLDELDWSDAIKIMQRNWIGKSEGANVFFKIDGHDETLDVFTTRPDTLFGVTYMVLAPEHKLVKILATRNQLEEVQKYIDTASNKSDLERTDLAKEKTGVFTGAYAINPVNNRKIPIWVSDYVLGSYGFGAIMAVPAHDQRDWEFAGKFNLPVIYVIEKDDESGKKHEECWVGDGLAINSEQFNGMRSEDFKHAIINWLEKTENGKRAVNYKLRDWIFSRQRYWGEPIPVVHCSKCGVVPLPEESLPLELPNVDSYEPSGTGESPLAKMEAWVNTICPSCGEPAKRETNTMPQWAGSCWYYLRYLDSENKNIFADKKKIEYWMPVDLYIGGAEHAVLHLLYARFWHKVLYDLELVNTKEPFTRLVNQGMILGSDNQKMSKSRGNVINPDDIIKEFGADCMRLYEMFMGPLSVSKPWSTAGVIGISRFLERLWSISEKAISQNNPEPTLEKLLHKTIKKVSEDTKSLAFNTAISQMMILSNELIKLESIPKKIWLDFIAILCPYAPHLAEELWEKTGEKSLASNASWPEFKSALCIDEQVEIVVQINGRIREKILVDTGTCESDLELAVLKLDKIKENLDGKNIKKIIVVKDKLVNIVAKE